LRPILSRITKATGALFWAVVLIALVGAGLRFAQVKFFYEPRPAEHLEQKQQYLERVARENAVGGRDVPNFVVVFFDDLGYGDLSSYGNELIQTPRIDALAASGLRMTEFYASANVCTPSRAGLLTGRLPHRSGTGSHVFFSEESPIATFRKFMGAGNEILADEILLPEALGAAGYATGMIGKWHLGGTPGFLPNDFGFDSYYGVLWSNDMQPLHIYRDREIEVEDTTEQNFGRNYRDEEDPRPPQGIDQSKLTQNYTDEALEFIEANRERPFFLYLAHSMPHVPHYASAEFAGTSEGGVYGDVVEDLDRSVGKLVDGLERMGLSENTLLLVTSDNGADYGGSPGFLRGRKGEILEGGQRVPMVANWPGRIPPSESAAMAMNTDFLPTLLGLAGVPLPADRVIDGRDLTPLFTEGAPSPHEYLYYLAPSLFASEPVVGAVRDARFKYLVSSGDQGRDRPHLTRLDADRENHDLRHKHPAEAARLAAAAQAMQEALSMNVRGWRAGP